MSQVKKTKEKTMDKENATKAAQTAGLLHQDLAALARSDNPVLVEYACNILQRLGSIEQELRRLAEVVE